MRALSDATAGMLKPVNLGPHDRLKIDVDKDLKDFICEITADTEGYSPTFHATRSWIQRIPERRELERFNQWSFAATDYTAEIIRAIWPDEKIIWKDEKALTLFNYLLVSTTQQDSNAEDYARWKADGSLPDLNGMELHREYPLAKYQQAATAISGNSRGYGLFMEQGTGKTPVVIARICSEAAKRDPSNPYRALVVCPKNVRLNWVREFERFATQPGKVEIIKGGEIKRITAFIRALVAEPDCKFCVAVISYESLVKSFDSMTHILDEICDGMFDLGVLDEGHYIKAPETARAKTAMRLRELCKKRLVLTGTPIGNSPLDLYSLFEFMGEGWSGFRSWQNFKSFYGVYKDGGEDSYKKLVGIQNLPFMKERLARLSFIIRKEEALPDLPDKVYDTDDVEMTERQQEVYDKIAADLLVEIESELDKSDNKAITINNILTKLLRLAQITCGYVTWDAVHDPVTLEELRPKSIEWFDDDPKLDRLVEILKEKGPNEKTIIWSCFVPCIERIHERLTKEGIDHVQFYGSTGDEARAEAERRFNYEPSCKVFLGNPKAGGTGLNLLGYPPHGGDDVTTNCNHVIYYAQDWSYITRQQSEDRAHRRGTRTNVRVTDLVVCESMDEEIRIRVLKKKMQAFEVTELREMLTGLSDLLKAEKERE